MKIRKLESTDAFIAFDLDEVPSVGITRVARKVLQDGAKLLARSTTYSFAFYGLRMGGASAGINAQGDDVGPAVTAFCDEAEELVSSGRWATDPGLGLTEADLATLRAVDTRPDALWNDGLATELTAKGAVAAAGAALDSGLSGASWSVVGDGPVVDAAKVAITEAGAVAAPGLPSADTECDILFLAGKAGLLDHEAAATVQARVVVPLTPVPVTARAHAELSKAGRVHVPDFVAIAAPLLAAHAVDGGDPVERVGDAVTALAGQVPDVWPDMWRAAVAHAEEFLSEWQDELPFGRPLA